jgi:putative ABC transport system permease protein
VEQRNKEIGIRKVNGASIHNIILLLNINLSKIVLIAFLLAAPISYILVYIWLENFAYKTNIPLWIFFLAGLMAFISTLLSIVNVTYTVAKRNPVHSLRYE